MKLRSRGALMSLLLFSMSLNGMKKIVTQIKKAYCMVSYTPSTACNSDRRPYDLSDTEFIDSVKKDTQQSLWKQSQFGYDCRVRQLVKFHAHFDNDLLRKHIMTILEYDPGNLALFVWCKDDIKRAYTLIGLLGIKKLYDGLLHTVNQEFLKDYYNAAYEMWDVPIAFESDFEPHEREHDESNEE